MRKLHAFSLLIVAAVSLLPGITGAQPAAVAPKVTVKTGDKKADDVLRNFSDYVTKLPAFSCKIETVLDASTKVQKNLMVTKSTFRLERPNRLALIVEDGMHGLTLVSDGKQLIQYLPMIKQYVVKPAPANFAGLAGLGEEMPPQIPDTGAFLIADSGKQLYERLMDGVSKSEYLGEEKIGEGKDEISCDHCRFMQEDFNWDIWIETGEKPVVRKVKPEFAKQLAAAGYELGDAKPELVSTFSEWNVSPKLEESDFSYKPPAPAKKVRSLFQEPPHPLVGKEAPTFTTTDVEGKAIDLKEHLGKNIVMLDFWATWCGPCVKAMPFVDEVAKKFKDKGLVFYAVNSQEDAETIKKFLEQAKLDPRVALDAKGEIGSQYNVEGIPQTVLIGKDGKVQVVHVGYSDELPKALTKEIEDLLAGKDLAKEALAE